MMAGDPFTSAIFRWLNGVAADASQPPAAFKLAYIISQHINRNSHTAWPSQETLACAIGIPGGDNATRTVRRLLKGLVVGGHLLTTRRKQTSLIYRLAQDRTELSYQAEQTETDETKTGDVRPDNYVRSSDQGRIIFVARTDNFDRQDRPELSAKPLNEPLKKNHESERRARASYLPDDFRISDETYSWALDRLGSNDAVDHSVERFTNHYRQADGTRAKSRDWDAKLPNWIDDDARKTQPDKSAVGAIKRLHDKIASFDALSDRTWDGILSTYVKTGRWSRHVDQCGSEPPSPDCRAPRHLLIKHGIIKEAAA
jgi:hypothetical protein